MISPASTEPSARYHLLTKPAVGIPIMLSEATKNAPIVQGSLRPMAMSLMFRLPDAQ